MTTTLLYLDKLRLLLSAVQDVIEVYENDDLLETSFIDLVKLQINAKGVSTEEFHSICSGTFKQMLDEISEELTGKTQPPSILNVTPELLQNFHIQNSITKSDIICSLKFNEHKSVDEISKLTTLNTAQIYNNLLIAKLPDKVKHYIREGDITVSEAISISRRTKNNKRYIMLVEEAIAYRLKK